MTSLRKALRPATLEERLVAEDLQPSVVAEVLPLYEKRDKPEVPNHVKDMAAEEGDIASVVDATVAGAPVQTGVKETVGIDTPNDMEGIDVDTLVSMAPEGVQVEGIFELDEDEIGKLLSVSNSDLFGGDAELRSQAEAALDVAEVRDGLRRGHVASGTDTFNQVCGEMNVPTQLRASFWRWLQSNERPGPVFTEEMIPRKGGKVTAGLRVPRPDGALWRKLRDAAVDGKDVSDRIKAFGAEISDTSELRISKEEERLNTQLATEVVKAWNAVLGNCEANGYQ